MVRKSKKSIANSNELYTKFLVKFWKENWENIDPKMIGADGCCPNTWEEFEQELLNDSEVRFWSLTELLDWGMKPGEYRKVRWREKDGYDIPDGYVLWEYVRNGIFSEFFLINRDTYDAYKCNPIDEEIVIVKKTYKIVEPKNK